MLLEGKKLLITGVLTDDSMAYAVAKVAQEAGAEILLTSFGRAMSLTRRVARRLPITPDVLELDANNAEHTEAVAKQVMERWGRLDGLVHAIAFAPGDALGGNFLNTPWESVATAFQTSAYSLKALTAGMLEPMKAAGRRLGGQPRLRRSLRVADLRLDGRLEGRPGGDHPLPGARPRRSSRIRVNTVSAGPIRTMAGKSIPGFDQIADRWLEPCAARLVLDRCDAGRPDGLLPPERLGGDDLRRADPRRRRLPRHGHRHPRQLTV